jgi:hypothetical protein
MKGCCDKNRTEIKPQELTKRNIELYIGLANGDYDTGNWMHRTTIATPAQAGTSILHFSLLYQWSANCESFPADPLVSSIMTNFRLAESLSKQQRVKRAANRHVDLLSLRLITLAVKCICRMLSRVLV